jgi:ubiquinone biosynthesis protein
MLRDLRNIGRLIGILWTLARFDALFPLDYFRLPPLLVWPLKLFARVARRPSTLRRGERVALALREMGPSFIKLGQSLATRADLVGEEIAADLSQLQDRLPAFSTAEAKATIEAELGRPLIEIFATFEDTPVAAASIAQVHFATVEGDDGRLREVAVKVLRPGIEQALARDLELFLWGAEWLVRSQPSFRRLKPIEAVGTFARVIANEMDLRMEAAAASEFGENFIGDPTFHVPAVDWRRTARRVLTLERVNGIRIDDRERLIAAGQDIDAVLGRAACGFFNQVFRDGFFHADLHPGNLFVGPDGVVQVVDFGIMGRLDLETRRFLGEMLLGFLEGDYRRVADVHFRAGYVPASESLEDFMQACRSIGEPILGLPLNEISIGRLLGQLFQVTERFNMETQPQLLLLQKTMVVAEGVGRLLNPSVNMWQLARPLIEDWVIANLGPAARVREGFEGLAQGLERLPRTLANLERAAAALANGGIRLHPDSFARVRDGAGRQAERSIAWALWAIAAILAACLAFSFIPF